MKMQNNRIKYATAMGVGAALGVAMGVGRIRRRISFRDCSVMITGGSRGLGLVLARQLAAKGARLVLVARDADGLQRAEDELVSSGAEVLTCQCDIRRQPEVNGAVARAVARYGGIDIVVNNAGIIQVGPLEEMKLADFEEALAAHFFGPLYLILAALPYLPRDGRGRIVNITSVAGKIAVPHLLPYVASKFALVGLSDGLRMELRRQKIRVTTVCPGLMRTGSPRNAMFKGKHREEYAWFSISDSLPLLSMNAERAARRIIAACRRGDSRLVLGAHIKAAVILNEIAPGFASWLLSMGNHLLPGLPGGATGMKMGWESESPWSPSGLTTLNEKAARRNNEMSA